MAGEGHRALQVIIIIYDLKLEICYLKSSIQRSCW